MMIKSMHSRDAGFSMIEVLVTLLIIMIALLGIAALQSRAQIAELEALQRTQALIILSDIMDTMNANKSTISCFAFTSDTSSGTPYIGTTGTGHLGTPECTAGTAAYNTQTVNAINALRDELRGGAEQLGGNKVGAMIGARACISYDDTSEFTGQPGTGLYTIIVTWQGMAELVAPASTMNCAVGQYGTDTKRRAVSATMRVADLL